MNHQNSELKSESSPPAGFGTFKGVFVPSILTIFGVIMYLRLGWILGHVGLFQTLVIVTISCSITFLTALSIAATSTNMKVGAGGTYYMISRSFGVETGAAIGIPLFFAQALGISFYIVGFSESLHAIFPAIPVRAFGVASLFLLTAIAYKSTNLALKTQTVVFLIIVLSLLSFFVGNADFAPNSSTLPLLEKTNLGFWVAFSIFFPAVTGIEAGLALSGDLKKPSRALPLGTLSAVIVGAIVYLIIPIVLSIRVSPEVLRGNTMIMQDMAIWGILVLLGIWGATLSSGMGALLGAPRTLQALAKDRVVFSFLGKGEGESNEPRLATVISFLIALVAILIGDLNAIAPVLSMFFLTAYGFLNLAAAIESFLQNPSWRPTFQTPWVVSLVGALACLAAMLMINPGATIISTGFVVGVFLLTKARNLGNRWSDMRGSMLQALAHYSIHQLSPLKAEARTWRPNILVFSGAPTKRWHLIELAQAFTQGKGFLTVATILTQDQDEERLAKMENSIRDFLGKKRVKGLVEVQPAVDVVRGAEGMIRSYGIGSIRPNTILLGDTENPEQFALHARLIRSALKNEKNVIIVRKPPSQETIDQQPFRIPGKGKKIIVWWGRQRQNANLMLALGHLLQYGPDWQGSELHLKSTIDKDEEKETATKALERFVKAGRLRAQVELITSDPTQDVFETLREKSSDADMVFIGIRPPEADESDQDYAAYYESLLKRSRGMPQTVIVMAAEPLKFNEIFE